MLLGACWLHHRLVQFADGPNGNTTLRGNPDAQEAATTGSQRLVRCLDVRPTSRQYRRDMTVMKRRMTASLPQPPSTAAGHLLGSLDSLQ
ncbi:hypothetical protein SAMN00790413_06163 [Deinococcus hopiensis KR-140]|uniref:Uncharacterized protein n=1 Tax=Deinococcus hopiensis KR-140 TaxID=695939 RepID=A0A1W1VWW8_9DEIO|nr:hypothetical protein SAMN00790413_06163 [Deinococcus hopiensis KR-140]